MTARKRTRNIHTDPVTHTTKPSCPPPPHIVQLMRQRRIKPRGERLGRLA